MSRIDKRDAERARWRAYVAKVERQAELEVMATLVTSRMFGALNAWEYVNDPRPSGLVALYEQGTPNAVRVQARQRAAILATHDADTCDDDECAVCDALYGEPTGTAAYL